MIIEPEVARHLHVQARRPIMQLPPGAPREVHSKESQPHALLAAEFTRKLVSTLNLLTALGDD